MIQPAIFLYSDEGKRMGVQNDTARWISLLTRGIRMGIQDETGHYFSIMMRGKEFGYIMIQPGVFLF